MPKAIAKKSGRYIAYCYPSSRVGMALAKHDQEGVYQLGQNHGNQFWRLPMRSNTPPMTPRGANVPMAKITRFHQGMLVILARARLSSVNAMAGAMARMAMLPAAYGLVTGGCRHAPYPWWVAGWYAGCRRWFGDDATVWQCIYFTLVWK